MPRFLQRRIEQGIFVIPLIISPCRWQEVPWLRSIQGRPLDNKPLTLFRKPQAEQCLADLVGELYQLLQMTPPRTTVTQHLESKPKTTINEPDNFKKTLAVNATALIAQSSKNKLAGKPDVAKPVQPSLIKIAGACVIVTLIAVAYFFFPNPINPPLTTNQALLAALQQGADKTCQITAQSNQLGYGVDKDELTITLSSNQSGYLSIFAIGSSTELYQIFPNVYDADNHIAADNPITLR